MNGVVQCGLCDQWYRVAEVHYCKGRRPSTSAPVTIRWTTPSTVVCPTCHGSGVVPPSAAPVDPRFCVLCLNGDHDRGVHNAALDGPNDDGRVVDG